MRRSLLLLLFVGCCTLSANDSPGQADEDPFAQRKVELKKLQNLSDRELQDKFSDTPMSWNERNDREKVTIEMLLTEMVRRGGSGFDQTILEKMRLQKNTVQEWKKKETEADKKRAQGLEVKPVDQDHPDEENLPMLIALRRLQKKPDPVEITVKQLDIAPTTRELPEFFVELKNVDVNKQPFHFDFGGDYRSGREARWAFEVRDAKGNLLPTRRREAIMGGGMYSTGDLVFGKTWTTTLPLGNYVAITEPGKYTALVRYHNTSTIADHPSEPGLILCTSKVFKFTIGKPVPRKVFVQTGSAEKTKSLVAALKGKTKIRVVHGEYTKDFHGFIDPTSPEGQLLQMGWSAVPGFLEILKDEKITKEQRAWVFALLNTVAHVDDISPVERRWDRIVGDYESRFRGGHSNWNGDIDVQVQKQFAKEWLTLAPELWEFVVDDAGFHAARLFEGRWFLEKGTCDGKPLLEKKDDIILLEIKQGQIVWDYRTRDDSPSGFKDTPTKAKFLINASMNPQAIDFDITQGKDAGKKRLGIFKFDGDQLILCMAAPGQKRPAEFKDSPGAQHTMSVWKRNPW